MLACSWNPFGPFPPPLGKKKRRSLESGIKNKQNTNAMCIPQILSDLHKNVP